MQARVVLLSAEVVKNRLVPLDRGFITGSRLQRFISRNKFQVASCGCRFYATSVDLSLGPLVNAEQLKEALQTSPDAIRCVDSSWHLGSDRNAREEFRAEHLPGAVFFDIDEIADKASPLPHMIPSEDLFASKVSDLGISNSDTIVAYATTGSFSAPRCWWTFRCFGHKKVHVLDGGMDAWKEVGGELEHKETKRQSTRPSAGLVQSSGNAWKLKGKGFQARLNAPMVKTWRQVLKQSDQGKESAGQIVDARSLARFKGEAPEPRPGVAGGHIPGSVSMPFTKVLQQGSMNRFLSPPLIREAFEEAGIDVESPQPIITSCGSGVSAAVLSFALEIAGRQAERSPVYNGAWAEWGSRNDLPRET